MQDSNNNSISDPASVGHDEIGYTFLKMQMDSLIKISFMNDFTSPILPKHMKFDENFYVLYFAMTEQQDLIDGKIVSSKTICDYKTFEDKKVKNSILCSDSERSIHNASISTFIIQDTSDIITVIIVRAAGNTTNADICIVKSTTKNRPLISGVLTRACNFPLRASISLSYGKKQMRAPVTVTTVGGCGSYMIGGSMELLHSKQIILGKSIFEYALDKSIVTLLPYDAKSLGELNGMKFRGMFYYNVLHVLVQIQEEIYAKYESGTIDKKT